MVQLVASFAHPGISFEALWLQQRAPLDEAGDRASTVDGRLGSFDFSQSAVPTLDRAFSLPLGNAQRSHQLDPLSLAIEVFEAAGVEAGLC
jgi:hypothetical protein